MMRLLIACAAALLAPSAAWAAVPAEAASLSPLWGLPFAGMLLSIALFPLLAASFWHHHYGKVALFWAMCFLIPYSVTFGAASAFHDLIHAALLEYIPFIVLLFALFTISGGLLVVGNIHGSPATNTALLAAGTLLASVIGTTGASMLLIRPLLRANDNRLYNVHTVVFFIFLVSNIGGSLTPLGDPPLFLGYLKGVDFFWTSAHLGPKMLFLSVALLVIFFLLDTAMFRKEGQPQRPDPTPDTRRIGMIGLVNVPLLIGVIAAILMSGMWKPGVSFDVLGTRVELQNIVRDGIILVLALVSLRVTSEDIRRGNDFDWEPIREVAKLFAGIFSTIIPVIAILRAGRDGAAAPLVDLVTDPSGTPIDGMYFWMTGLLSGVLDNAPTYLVFFNLAGGDAQHLMTAAASTLAAISAGAVFMGALTYVGNAPNFMVLAIAKSRGVRMPSFFGYMLWSGAVLVPLFVLVTLLFFHM
jgi:Na+/H+ antiporter NhaD/arsenite permease-like protein